MVSGSCALSEDGTCFSSRVRIFGRPIDDECILEVEEPVSLQVQDFALAAGDQLWVDGVGFTERERLQGKALQAGSAMAWSFNPSTNGAPLKVSICAGALPCPLTPHMLSLFSPVELTDHGLYSSPR